MKEMENGTRKTMEERICEKWVLTLEKKTEGVIEGGDCDEVN